MSEDVTKLPHYGGNKIPAKWFAEWKKKHGFDKKPLHDEMPAWMQREIEREFGK